MLKILQIVCSIITVAFAGYALVTKDFQFQVYMMLFLGLTMLVLGLQQFKRNQKMMGWMLVAVFAFSLFVAIQSILLT